MPARAGTAEVLFEGNFSKLNKQATAATKPLGAKLARSTNQAVGPTSKLGRAADKSTGSLNRLDKASGRTNKGLRTIGRGAAYALGAGGFGGGLYAIFDVTKKAVGEFREAQKVSRQTAAVLKSTGGIAGVTAREVSKLAEAISKKTGIDDEAVQAGENLLLTFKNIRDEKGPTNTFARTTQAAVDMSAAMQAAGKSMSIGDATLQLAKALTDPEKGLTRLMRVGVDFTAQQKEQITTLAQSGQRSKAQALILREVEAQFTGSAARQKTAGKSLQVTLGNVGETIGKAVAPTLTKGANAVNKFANEMLKGKGDGGRFVSTLKGVWTEAKPIVTWLGRAAVNVGKFAGKHPEMTKLALGITAAGVAVNGIRTSKAMGGITTLLGGLRKLARTKAGEAAANSITSALGGVPGRSEKTLGRTRSVFRRVLGGAGTVGGTAAAESIVHSTGTGIDKRKGRFSGAGKRAGKFVGKGIVSGVVAGLILGYSEYGDELQSWGQKIQKKIFGDNAVTKFLNKLDKAGPFDFRPNRKGGRVFGAGGRVPVRLSSGEMGIEPGGRTFMVPGRPVAADNVAAFVKPGTAILTSSGQAMMAGGASIHQALAHQAPHFATGGQVAGLAARTGLRGRKLQESVAISGAESHWDENAVSPRNSDGSVDRGLWQINSIHGKLSTLDPVGNARAMSKISGKGSNWRPWTEFKNKGYLKWMGRAARAVKLITGTAGGGLGRSRKLTVTTPAGITHPLLGNILSPLVDDALLGGIEAGKSGTGRLPLLTSVLEGIAPESSDYATRRTETLSGLRGGSKTDRAGLKGGSDKAKVVARMQAFGDAITAKRLGYTYGGWHPAGNKSGQPDCSGLVSNILLRGSGKFATRGTNYTTDTFKSWGQAGPGKHITVGVRGSTGRNAHTMIQVGNKFYESANSRGPAGRRSGWSGNFPIKRHPPGYRAGGVVPEMVDLSKAPGKARAALMRPGALDPSSPTFVGWGLRKGGTIRGRKPRRIRPRKRPGLKNLIGALGGTPGNRRAAGLTQTLSKRVAGRSVGALIKARNDIRKRIRAMAKNGLTGQERIQTRRLRGALALIEDELGRPIGSALGSSDLYQDITSRSLGNLENELIIAGVDPESAAGQQAKMARTRSALGSLTGRRAVLGQALTRAKATGSREAVGQVQAEINEVDDQILGLRADLTTLSNATQEQTAETERLRSMLELQTQKTREATQRTAVSERHFNVFGGSFARGGVVPGPAGAPRIIRAHGGERITSPNSNGPSVRVVMEDHRTRVFVDDVERIVEQKTRSMARTGARGLPGRSGGGLRG